MCTINKNKFKHTNMMSLWLFEVSLMKRQDGDASDFHSIPWISRMLLNDVLKQLHTNCIIITIYFTHCTILIKLKFKIKLHDLNFFHNLISHLSKTTRKIQRSRLWLIRWSCAIYINEVQLRHPIVNFETTGAYDVTYMYSTFHWL